MIDLTLDEDAQEIVTAVCDLLARAAPLDRLRQDGSETKLAQTLAEVGWFAMADAPEAGGLGIGLAQQALIHIEAGRRLVSPSMLATMLAATHGPEDLRAGFRSGGASAAFILHVDSGESFAIEAASARLLVNLGKDRLSFHLREDFVGSTVESFDEVLPVERGRLGAGPVAMAEDPSGAVLLLSALLAGTAAGAAELAIEYAKVREQFGQPIGAFQAVKHRCTDMGVAAFAAEAQVTMAAAALDENALESAQELAVAALQAIRCARANGAGVVQMHGGMGFTAECHAHRFFKRAHLLERLLGGEERFAAEMLARVRPH